jgi:hypothetical protein
MSVRSGLSELRQILFTTNRGLGDIQAIASGTIVKRLARRSVTRSLFRVLR